MKIFIFIICILFSIGNMGYAQKVKKITDAKNDNLFGRIKTIQTIEYTASMGENGIEKGEKISSLFKQYNPAGYLLESSEHNSDGSMMQKEIFTYDKKNNRILELSYTEDDKVDQRVEIKYDAMNFPLKILTKDEKGKTFQKTIYQYNERGEIVQQNGYDYRGKLTEKSYYTYDNRGNLIQYVGYGEFDNRKISYQYNANNEITESIILNIKNVFIEKIIHTYSDSPKSVKKTYLDINSKPLKSESYTYDINENLLEMTLADEHANITEKHIFTYQYDDQKNWIVQITYIGFEQKIVSIAERTITYY